jgi:predicted nucleotidyltransferase component of viral defense system
MSQSRYHSPAAFRRALDDRLKTAARRQGIPFNALRRQFVLECYLARVFSLPEDRWVLKGGTGLAVRIPGARHSRDLDLCNTATNTELSTCVEELAAAGRSASRDPFVFDITRKTELTGIAEGIQLTVDARLGPASFERFPIDLTTRLEFVGQIEIVTKPLPVTIDGVAPPPPMRLYPISDQIADKVAAMYQDYNGHSSGRFRDLVDLVIIVSAPGFHLDIDTVTAALQIQQSVRRMTLPAAMTAPGPSWTHEYPTNARRTGIPHSLQTLDAALRHVGAALNPVLIRLATEPDT